MTSYTEWWEGLRIPLKIYWGIAIPFSLFFLLQLLLSFFGGDDVPDDVPDVEVEHDAGFGSRRGGLQRRLVIDTKLGVVAACARIQPHVRQAHSASSGIH